MKVLFAVNNENISESIIKKYQQEYREIISSKNVYYFNAITKELQKDKSYDRIIISEDLEPFSNNNYEIIDKFIFEKLDNISDEAVARDGHDIPIILICADRRNKSENFLIKIFGIGVYSALLGQDRSITKVCELINKPRSKKDAKIYYKIESENVDYKNEGESDVSELEIQNILNHYKRLGKNEDRYVESFDNIAAQYTDAQLRVICKFLPLNVKAVLESQSSKYQELVTFGNASTNINSDKKIKGHGSFNRKPSKVNNVKEEKQKLDIIEKNIGKTNLSKPVVIPSSINISNVKKMNKAEEVRKPIQEEKPLMQQPKAQIDIDDIIDMDSTNDIPQTMNNNQNNINEMVADEFINNDVVEKIENSEVGTTVRRRGRPKKIKTEEELLQEQIKAQQPKRKRGRPKKETIIEKEEDNSVLPGIYTNEPENDNILPGFDQEEPENDNVLPGFDQEETEDDNVLPGFDEEETEDDNVLPGFDEEETEQENNQPEDNEEGLKGGIILPGFDEIDDDNPDEISDDDIISGNQNETYLGTQKKQSNENYEQPVYKDRNNSKEVETKQQYIESINLDGLLTRDKKIVSFVGTSKNGVSFLVNNLAEAISKKGIKTAILDLTQNKNSYYIYTQNEEELRRKAFSCIPDLVNGLAHGIQVNKNLDVYTTLPEESDELNNYRKIITTLAQNYSLILMDCDFNTNYGYFKNCQEIYLVQSFDILTIQPLTAFLRDLKAKNVLNTEKLRVVLNKALRVRSVNDKTIIGGMAFYNDPAMSFMTELFNKDTIQYCVIPFEEQTYSRYLEGLVNCEISLNGYSKNFMMSLEKLVNMVYPLIDGGNRKNTSYNTNPNGFSNDMNATLNKMKNTY